MAARSVPLDRHGPVAIVGERHRRRADLASACLVSRLEQRVRHRGDGELRLDSIGFVAPLPSVYRTTGLV